MLHLRAGCRRSQLATLRPKCTACQQQRRWRTENGVSTTEAGPQRESTPLSMFVRHKEPDGQIWYSLKSPLSRLKRPKDPKFFEMPNIVIDLDAEGLRGVRQVDGEDEKKLNARGAISPARVAAKATVNELERNVMQMRESWTAILNQPLSAWRINHHDVMSVALRGVRPGSGRQTLKDGRDGSGSKDRTVLEVLCKRNGIPSYACKDDRLLLEWMLLRKGAMEDHLANNPEHVAALDLLVDEIERSENALSIRRLLAAYSFGTLGNEKEGPAFDVDGMVGPAITKAVRESLKQRQLDPVRVQEALTVVANIESSLWHFPLDSATLWSFGLELARLHSAEAVIAYLRRGLQTEYSAVLPDFLQCIASAIETVVDQSGERGTAQLWDIGGSPNGSNLLHLLTGVSESGERSTSIRSEIFRTLEADHNTTTDLPLSLYMNYITLLGRIGAVRTLWVEYQALPSVLSLLASPGQDEEELARAVTKAVVMNVTSASALGTEPQSGIEKEEDITFDVCAWSDHAAVAARANTMLEEEAVGERDYDTAKLEAALAGSLSEWMAELYRQW